MAESSSLPIALLWDDTIRLCDTGSGDKQERAELAREAYVAELVGNVDEARAIYVRLSGDESVRVRDWTYVRLAALAGKADIAVLEEIEKRYRDPWPWLSVEALWTLGRILKQVPSAISKAKTALNDAFGRARALLPPPAPGVVQLERELIASLWIELIGVLLRRGREGKPFSHELDRALRLFRAFRRDTEVRATGSDREAADVPEGTLRIEFLCAPGEMVFLATGTAHGFLVTDVHELSLAMQRFQSRLYKSDTDHPTKTLAWLVEVNGAVLAARKRLDGLLVHAPIKWSDGSRTSLDELLGSHRRVEIVSHGPTQMVPWSLLRRADGRCLGETVEIVCPPSDLRVTREDESSSAVVHEEMRGGDTARSLLERLGRGRIAWLRGHGKFCYSDPLTSVTTPLRESQQITTADFLSCVPDAPLGRVVALFVSICEAAESHRRSIGLDFLHAGYALLAAGARTVVVPTTTVTSASDRLVQNAIASCSAGMTVAKAWKDALQPHLSSWRGDLSHDELADHVRESVRTGSPTAGDLGAFIVIQSAGEP